MNLAKTMFPTAYEAAVGQPLPIVEGEVEIVRSHGQVCGVRDRSGFLLFFPTVTPYRGQGNRYKEELEKQSRLAEIIINALRNP